MMDSRLRQQLSVRPWHWCPSLLRCLKNPWQDNQIIFVRRINTLMQQVHVLWHNYNVTKSAWVRFPSLLPIVFCFFRTSLPLASTRWVWTTIKLCTVHSLSSALSLNLSNIKKFRKNLGNAENRTRAGWVWSANATSVLCRPPWWTVL